MGAEWSSPIPQRSCDQSWALQHDWLDPGKQVSSMCDCVLLPDPRYKIIRMGHHQYHPPIGRWTMVIPKRWFHATFWDVFATTARFTHSHINKLIYLTIRLWFSLWSFSRPVKNWPDQGMKLWLWHLNLVIFALMPWDTYRSSLYGTEVVKSDRRPNRGCLPMSQLQSPKNEAVLITYLRRRFWGSFGLRFQLPGTWWERRADAAPGSSCEVFPWWLLG